MTDIPPSPAAQPFRYVHSANFPALLEQLKLSLRGLSAEKFFTVVWFGDRAGLLRATNGSIATDRESISAVRLQCGSADIRVARSKTMIAVAENTRRITAMMP